MVNAPGSAREVRPPAVAGIFYPAEPQALRDAIRRCLDEAARRPAPRMERPPRALIVPHAGYVYSGPIAASAYVRLAEREPQPERVVLLGPAHRVLLRGLAATGCSFFSTPLGRVPVDRAAIERVAGLPQVAIRDDAHAREHSLEVQLPFLQCVIGEFRLVPFVVGEATPEEVAEVIECLWGGPETFFVISSDLSHYYDYATAQRLDTMTTRAIEALAPERLEEESACGRVPVRGMLVAARRHGLRVTTLDLRNSGDTAGGRDEVVGYGAYAFW